MSDIIQNYNSIINQIKFYKKKFSKTSKNPKLIVVSKTFPNEKIEVIVNKGHRIFGENRVQEAIEKWPVLKSQYNDIELHLLGGLQSNKIKQALEIFDVIQTIDREKIVLKVLKHLKKTKYKKKHKFFVQINTGDESQKNGIQINETKDFVKWCLFDQRLNVTGLMCIPPANDLSSIHFNLLSDLCEKCNLKETSMGMTKDFKEAIQFGATYLRIGTGVFGTRKN